MIFAVLILAPVVAQPVSAAGPKEKTLAERVPDHVNWDRIPDGSPISWKRENARFDWLRRADRPFALKPPSKSFSIRYQHRGRTYDLEDYFRHGDTLAFLVLKDDQIILERYLHGTTRTDRYLSMSVAKSVVSILVGVAVDEGRIRSVRDPIVRYLPYLGKSGYAKATVEDVLHMATGVRYSENYAGKPMSGTPGIGALARANWTGNPTFADFAASLPSRIPPGTKSQYQSVNTQVLGLLLERVAGTTLARYAEVKLWKKIGAERFAYFATGKRQQGTIAYSGFFATLRDYGRFGLMVLNGGSLGDSRVVSEDWIRRSSTPAPFAKPRFNPRTRKAYDGYGYQWWIPYDQKGDRAFMAIGIKGQTIYINPAKRIVIAKFSAWPNANPVPEHLGESDAVFEAIVKKLAGD